MPQSLPLDPIGIYMMNPRLGDFILFGLLFFAIVKIALAGSHQLREKKGLLSSLGTALKGHSEHKMDNLRAIALSLILTISLVGIANISLKGLVQSGTFFTILAVVAGFIAYGAFASRFKDENWWMALLSAFFVAVIVYILPTFRPGGQTISGLATLFAMVIVIFLAVRKTSSKVDTGRDSETTRRDLDISARTSERFGEDVEKARIAAEKASRQRPGIKQRFTQGLNSVRRFKNLLHNALGKKRLLEAAFAAALLLWQTHSFGQIRQELTKKYPPSVVESVMKSLPKKQTTEIAPPGAGEKPVETVEEIPVPPEDVSQIVENIDDVKISCTAQVQSSQLRINEFDEILKALNIIPADYAKLKGEMAVIESDVSALLSDADSILKDAQKTGNAELTNNAELARESAFGIKEIVIPENSKFRTGAETTVPILNSDEAALKSISQQLQQSLSELKKVSNEFVSSSNELKGKVGWADINLFYNISSRYESLIVAILQLFDTEEGTPETLVDTLRGIEKRIGEYRKFLALTVESVNKYRATITELQSKLTEMKQVKETEKKAEVAEFADIAGIIDKAKSLFNLIRTIQREDLEDPNVFDQFGDVLTGFSQQTTALATLMTSEKKKIAAIPAVSGSPEERLMKLLEIPRGSKMSSLISYSGQLTNSFEIAKRDNDKSRLKDSIANLRDYPDLLDTFIGQLQNVQRDIRSKIT